MKRITIMSGPIRFMILAIVIGIRKSPICLFRKEVVQRSIDSYRIARVIFPKTDRPTLRLVGSWDLSSICQACLVKKNGIKKGRGGYY